MHFMDFHDEKFNNFDLITLSFSVVSFGTVKHSNDVKYHTNYILIQHFYIVL